MENMENQSIPPFDISGAPWVVCSCGSYLFEPVTMIKKISQFESPTGREEHAPVDVVSCKSCGKIPNFVSMKIRDIPESLIENKSIITDGK